MESSQAEVSRRTFLASVGGIAGAFALGGVAGAAGGFAIAERAGANQGFSPSATVDFFGPHQAGIETATQAHGVFLGFNLKSSSTLEHARRLMKLLTDDASRLSRGIPALPDNDPDLATQPSRLTVTFGFGPSFFSLLGLSASIPAGFRPIPAYSIDRLQPQYGQSDFLIQVGCDDPLTLSHAVRQLTRTAQSFARPVWAQRGFVRAAGTLKQGETPRNLMGQLDGTVNPRPNSDAFGEQVWAQDAGWFTHGTMLVLRRISMDLGGWDKLDEHDKEMAMGRKLRSGAPLTGEREHDKPDLAAVDETRLPIIPDYAHIRRAAPANARERFLRRPFNFDDGILPDGSPNAGLLFAAYMANIQEQYIPVQNRLAKLDVMNRWTTPIGSSVFVIPPGCRAGGFIGEGLLS